METSIDNPRPATHRGGRPPGPRGHAILGSFPEIRRDPLAFLIDCAARFGDSVHARIVNVDAYLFSHPDDIEHILVTANRSFIKARLLRDAGEVLGRGLLTGEGELWLRQRRLMQPAFHRDRIAGYGSTMVEHTEAMLDRWGEGGRLDVHDEMMRLTLSIVARTLFGADVSGREADVEHALEIALQRFIERMSLLRVLDRLPLPRNRRFKRALGTLDGIIYGIIEERRRSGSDGNDLLSLLLEARDDDGSSMTDTQLRDEAITLFLAGHETTAIAMSWTWYLLSGHPDVEARLVAELEEVLGGRAPEMADIPRLTYTDTVIRESMRLYPPAWRIGREAIEPCTIGGYRIPVGAQVIMSQWIVHRDPRYYEEPEAFRPERWEGDLARRLPKFAYFPFGGGARRCIGDSFAMMEAVLLLATIARRYHLELSPDARIELWPSITLRPKHGLPMVATRR
jgi:cytochrome P450